MPEKFTGSQAETLILNSLAAVVGKDKTIFADRRSYDLARETYLTVTSPKQRVKIRSIINEILSEVDNPSQRNETAIQTLQGIVHDVISELIEKNVEITVDHQVEITFPEREAVLYTFACTRDPDVLTRLSLSHEVESKISNGGRLVANGEFTKAAKAFEEAVDQSAGEGTVSTRVLAALANHWRGNDTRALDLVEETLHLETEAWSATLAGLAADHRYPEKFRSNKLGVRTFLRHTIDVPDNGSISIDVKFDEASEWTTLPGDRDCLPLERLESAIHLRIKLSGLLPNFPVIQGYYLGLGVVDLEVSEAREVDQLLFSGPENSNAIETIRLKRQI